MATPERPTAGHARSKSSFSFRSNKSDKSDPNRSKSTHIDLHETEQERQKARFAVQTVRDPNKAIRDAQPSERMQEANTIPHIRQAQYKDWKGDVITDADSSNPTRPRMERPLDTIRSFEAAIDNEWKRKSQMIRSESADFTQYSSRRNSLAAGNDPSYNRRSTPVGGYNSNRNTRYNDHYAQRPGNSRFQSSPMAPTASHTNGYNVNGYAGHPSHGYSQSYDTVDTGGSYGTSGSEPWTNSTDPSSENSSIERAHGINGYKPDHPDAYGGQYRRESPRHDAIQEEYGFDGNGYTQGEYHGPFAPQGPTPPRHSGQWAQHRPMAHPAPNMGPPPPAHQPPRNVIPLGGSAGPVPPKPNTLQQRPPLKQQSSSGEGKRKSWLKRRFSKG